VAKIGMIHYNIPGTLEEFLRYAKGAGYDYVELQCSQDVWGKDVTEPEKQAEKVRKMVDAAGLKVSALAAQNDFIQPDEAGIKAQVERMQRICGLARSLGTNMIRSEGGQPKANVSPMAWPDAMAECFKRCLPFLEKDDMYLAVDNHGIVTNDIVVQLLTLKAVGSKHVGANVDTMNYRWYGHDLVVLDRIYEMIAPYALHTHMKDGTGSRRNYKGAALGEGEINLRKAIACLKAVGYDGVWCSEYEGKADPSDVGYRKCADWLKKNV